jgi:proteasome lid subunit RPN8/RPN11
MRPGPGSGRIEIGPADRAAGREWRDGLSALRALADTARHQAGNDTAGSLGSMRIGQALHDEIVAHAIKDAPNECCGMIASRDGEAVKVYPAENAAASPLRYEIDGAEQYRIQMAIDDAGLDLGAIYHSHTRSEPYPSQTDINFAKDWPGVLWIIIGLANGEPEVKTYEIRDGQVAEAQLEIH